MKNAYGVELARSAFNNGAIGNHARYPGPFPAFSTEDYSDGMVLAGLRRAGSNGTQQFVGGYEIRINRLPDGNMQFVLDNVTSWKSVASGSHPVWWNPARFIPRIRSHWVPGRDWHQVYYWTEPPQGNCNGNQ